MEASKSRERSTLYQKLHGEPPLSLSLPLSTVPRNPSHLSRRVRHRHSNVQMSPHIPPSTGSP
jgi:hypothetical protein